MTVPMDSTPDVASTERVQRLYNKNVELENRRRKAAQARIPSDPNAWQKMRENYETIVLEDHTFSEQHDIEYALWQLHYRRIEELRAHFTAALASAGSIETQNGKGPTRHGPDRITKIRSQFKTLLSEATGFYHDLMVKIRAKYGLPLGYISDDSESQILCKEGNKSAEVKKGLISCHRCLIYLGDLARYKGLYGDGDSKARDFAAASSYYMQASSLWPSSGNSHHQLAILASYSGDELVAVYRYFRSLAVKNPFSTARDNLIIAFEKNRQSYSQLLGDIKASSVKTAPARMTGKGRGKGEARVHLKDARVEASLPKDKASSIPGTFKAFSIRFVRLNGILFTRTSMETFGEIFSLAKSDLLELLSSGPNEEYTFGADVSECRLLVIRMIAILIFMVHNMNREAENQSYAEILQRSVFLQNAFTAVFEFMGHILERCTQLTDPSNSYLLPGIMVFVEWLACRPDIAVGSDVEEKQAGARTNFWSHCISFMNKLLSSGLIYNKEDEDETCFFNMSRYDESETSNRVALSEDFELRGFVPLLPAQLILDFSRKLSFGSDGGNKEKKFRVQRIIAAGKALATVIQGGQQVIYFNPKSKRFAICAEPQMSDDFSLSSSLEIPTLNGTGQENLVKKQLYMEGEEEDDEVIVFKPSVIEKNADAIASTLTSSELGSHFGPFSASPNGFLQQTALSTSLIPPTSLANITAQYIQPIQPSTSTWLVDQQSSIANGLTNLSILDNNGLPGKPESFNLTGGSNYHVPFPETTIPSKFGSITSSGVIGGLSMNPPSIMPMGLRKNPVSRPVRHLGPPPGFSSVPPKFVDESLSGVPMKNENPPMDDYSWLDGYQFPSSTQGIGFNNSIGHKSNSSMGMVSFPFPGKQDAMMQGQVENQKGLQGYQFPEHLNIYHRKQQKGNQHSDALPEYQGQSLWEGRFFV